MVRGAIRTVKSTAKTIRMISKTLPSFFINNLQMGKMCIHGDAHFTLELEFGNQLLQSGQHTDLIGSVGRQLPEVMGAVGVALDTMKQLEQQMVMRNYQGFLK